MGRRSRSRNPDPAARRAARPARPAPTRQRALEGLTPVRRTLAIYLGLAMLLSVLTVAGIAILGGTVGPFVVLAYAMVGGGLAYRWAQLRLADKRQELSDEDRVMQTMAGGLLAISVALAALSAVVLSVA